jgi:hypothetical protein
MARIGLRCEWRFIGVDNAVGGLVACDAESADESWIEIP